ncbi:Hypothetical predicted protein [Mytilus galloprovincialis]|uniref:Uncharacterized protein n=1 Tax=Mytilus galloprovincialis TaxID=29158 RepID=A0A8B6GEL9_MYTGA|nr:Hypothetical predicted protein [Mytilus galloprovincialis]
MNTSELQRHAELLQKLCRLCGHEIDLRYKYDKHHFNEELGDMYGMDLNFDLDHIHPSAQAKGKEGKKFTTDLIPFSFDKHTDKCKICLLSNDSEGEAKRGRPKKRKILKPEKIIKEWKNEQDDDEIPSKALKDNSTECKHSEVQINCKPCFSYVKKQFCTLFKNRKEDEKLMIVKEFMLELDTSDISLFAYVIGLQQRKSIKEDAQSFAMMYKDLDTVAKFKSNDWLQDRNPVVKNFCFGMCGLPSNSSTMDDNQTLIVMTTVEQSYKLCEPKLVSPFAFLQNLCIYSLTGSKQAVDIVGKTKPAGCYKTVVSKY